MATFTQRIIGAARLDARVYEEVEHDSTATSQAVAVVILSSLATGLGALAGGEVLRVLGFAVAELVGWLLMATLIYVIGARVMPEPQTRADVGQLLRTIGFAASPGILSVIEIVPLLGGLLGFLISIWVLVATIIAVRQALDYNSTSRAVIVCAIGWVAYIVVRFFAYNLLGVGAFLSGAATR